MVEHCTHKAKGVGPIPTLGTNAVLMKVGFMLQLH